MKFFKDISFWCIILTIVVIMVVHHILSKHGNIIEGGPGGAMKVDIHFSDEQVPAETPDERLARLAAVVLVGADDGAHVFHRHARALALAHACACAQTSAVRRQCQHPPATSLACTARACVRARV